MRATTCLPRNRPRVSTEGTLSDTVAWHRATVLLRSHNLIGEGDYCRSFSLTLKIQEQWLFSCALVTQAYFLLATSLQWMKYSRSIGCIRRTSGPFPE